MAFVIASQRALAMATASSLSISRLFFVPCHPPRLKFFCGDKTFFSFYSNLYVFRKHISTFSFCALSVMGRLISKPARVGRMWEGPKVGR